MGEDITLTQVLYGIIVLVGALFILSKIKIIGFIILCMFIYDHIKGTDSMGWLFSHVITLYSKIKEVFRDVL